MRKDGEIPPALMEMRIKSENPKICVSKAIYKVSNILWFLSLQWRKTQDGLHGEVTLWSPSERQKINKLTSVLENPRKPPLLPSCSYLVYLFSFSPLSPLKKVEGARTQLLWWGLENADSLLGAFRNEKRCRCTQGSMYVILMTEGNNTAAVNAFKSFPCPSSPVWPLAAL